MATPAFPRMLRTGLTASLVVGLGVGGHVAGGGLLPDPVVLAALCALLLIPVTALTRSRFSFPLLTAVLGAGQVWLHWSLVAFAPVPFQRWPRLSSRPTLSATRATSATQATSATCWPSGRMP